MYVLFSSRRDNRPVANINKEGEAFPVYKAPDHDSLRQAMAIRFTTGIPSAHDLLAPPLHPSARTTGLGGAPPRSAATVMVASGPVDRHRLNPAPFVSPPTRRRPSTAAAAAAAAVGVPSPLDEQSPEFGTRGPSTSVQISPAGHLPFAYHRASSSSAAAAAISYSVRASPRLHRLQVLREELQVLLYIVFFFTYYYY